MAYLSVFCSMSHVSTPLFVGPITGETDCMSQLVMTYLGSTEQRGRYSVSSEYCKVALNLCFKLARS